MVISYQKTLNTFVVVKKTQSPKAYLGVFIMPFDCVGVTMHIEGHILEFRCCIFQNKDILEGSVPEYIFVVEKYCHNKKRPVFL